MLMAELTKGKLMLNPAHIASVGVDPKQPDKVQIILSINGEDGQPQKIYSDLTYEIVREKLRDAMSG